jgi:DNA-directed RNA polymerase sigma subunit (sigma70/sigma32)
MISIASHETEKDKNRRIDCLLREMVIEEALGAIEDNRLHQSFTLQEIADFVGVGKDTIDRIESKALRKLQNKMIDYKIG